MGNFMDRIRATEASVEGRRPDDFADMMQQLQVAQQENDKEKKRSEQEYKLKKYENQIWRAKEQQKHKWQLELEKAKAKAKADDPIASFLQKGKILDAVQSMNDAGIDTSRYEPLINELIGGAITPSQTQKKPTTPILQKEDAPTLGGQFKPNIQPPGQPEAILPTEVKPNAFGRWKATKGVVGSTEMKKKQISKAVDVSAKQLDTFLSTNQDFGRVRAAMEGLVSRSKQVVDEIGGYGAKQFVLGKAKELKARSGFFEDIPPEEQMSGLKNYEGQLQEVMLSLSPILTGSKRVMRGVLKMLGKTLPKFGITGTTETAFAGQLKQTFENAFKISMILSKTLISPEQVQALSNKSDEEIQEFIDIVEQRYKNIEFSGKDKELFNELWNDVKAVPASRPETFQPFNNQFKKNAPSSVGELSDEDIQREIDELNRRR